MYRAFIFVISIFSISLLSSCSGTRTLGTWEKAGLKAKKYTRIVVYTNAPTIAARAMLERGVAKQLNLSGIHADAASDLVPAITIDSITRFPIVTPSPSTEDSELLLVIIYGSISRSFQQTLVPGKASQTYSTPTTITKCESRLYTLESYQLIISVDTESVLRLGLEEDYKILADDLGAELVSQFRNKAISF